jgi:hypothetical protein
MAEDPGYVHYANGVDATEAAHWWIREFPAAAVKVLLETGALEPAGVLDTESGLLHVCGPDDEPEPQDVRVFRLANEESTQ